MSLQAFFTPRSVAVIGASRTEGKVGYEILNNLVRDGFEGDIYPINPKVDEVQGLKCYPDVASIGSCPDLAIIILPAKIVPAIMKQCSSVGVKAVIIITAGFKEVGEEGRLLENEVLNIARQGGMRIIGPNCLGLINTTHKLNASFGGNIPDVGVTGYLSQSGALLTAILDMAKATGLGFSKLVLYLSCLSGNKTCAGNELLQALNGSTPTNFLHEINFAVAVLRQIVLEEGSGKLAILVLEIPLDNL
jgi:acyl-CoA synthetase (NDP forming)